MRLIFDARYIRTDFHDGISRFSHQLAHALVATAPADVEITFLIHDEAQRALLPAGSRTHLFHAPTSAKEAVASLLLNKLNPDVVYSPMQTLGSAGRKFKLILTLHDMIYYRHRTPPRNLPWPVRVGWRLFHLTYVPQRITLNGADIVATVSEESRRQFGDVNLTKREVIVIHNAPQKLAEQLPAGVTVTGGAPRNLVYMGSFMPYKNVETVVRAMAYLPGRTLHVLSRITPEWRADYEALAAPGTNIVFHNGVTDAEFAATLADDGALVTLSLDEGYGLPVAEALELGVPAVVTDMPIFREVAGAGALYVDPLDPAAVAAAVVELDDDAARADLIARGEKHVARFSWERSAGVLLDAVQRLARR